MKGAELNSVRFYTIRTTNLCSDDVLFPQKCWHLGADHVCLVFNLHHVKAVFTCQPHSVCAQHAPITLAKRYMVISQAVLHTVLHTLTRFAEYGWILSCQSYPLPTYSLWDPLRAIATTFTWVLRGVARCQKCHTQEWQNTAVTAFMSSSYSICSVYCVPYALCRHLATVHSRMKNCSCFCQNHSFIH